MGLRSRGKENELKNIIARYLFLRNSSLFTERISLWWREQEPAWPGSLRGAQFAPKPALSFAEGQSPACCQEIASRSLS